MGEEKKEVRVVYGVVGGAGGSGGEGGRVGRGHCRGSGGTGGMDTKTGGSTYSPILKSWAWSLWERKPGCQGHELPAGGGRGTSR